MRVLVTGATGLIGKKVCQELLRRKHEVMIVSRDPDRATAKLKLPVMEFKWAAGAEPLPPMALDRVDAVVHLAGEPIADHFWTKATKERIVRSRTESTGAIAQSFREQSAELRPKVFVAASAIGYYGDRPGDELLTERSGPGKGFLAETCAAWEAASTEAGKLCQRHAIIRIGLVLSKDGGLLSRMAPPFRSGLGAIFGPGQNWMSWIHIRDLIRLICDAVEKPAYQGPVNAVSPRPVWQREFARELALAVGKKRVWKVPAVLIKLPLREMSELVLGSQRVKPELAQAAGFKFEFESVAQALRDLLAPENSSV